MRFGQLRIGILSLVISIPAACSTDVLRGNQLAADIGIEAVLNDAKPPTPGDAARADSNTVAPDAVVVVQDGAAITSDGGAVARDSGVGASCTRGGLRSALYPDNWMPGFKDSQGRFLHDFSYAGYRHGEAPLPTGDFATVYDVTQAPYGADNTGSADATAAVQGAIDAATGAGGGIVFLPAGTYRLKKLRVKASNVVLRGAGSQRTKLHFPNGGANPSISFEGASTTGAKAALTRAGEVFATHVTVDDIAGLAVGDHIELTQTITQAFIDDHKMRDYWSAQLNKRYVFFRRRIAAIDSATKRVSFHVPLRYPLLLRDSPELRQVRGLVEECGLEQLSISNAADTMEEAWSSNGWAALKFEHVSDCWVRGVRSYESIKSKTYHLRSKGIVLRSAKSVTVQDVHLGRTQNSGGGGNGYHFNPQMSSEILFKDCTGQHARHSFTVTWPFGSSGIVFLRIHSYDSIGYLDWDHYQETLAGTREPWSPLCSDFHMQLSMANLVDQSVIDDGWYAINRGNWSAYSGMTSTQCVFWNNSGKGKINSYQFGWGYVIGTQGLDVRTEAAAAPGAPGTSGGDQDTQPYDYVEHLGAQPSVASLYEDQLARRLGRCP